MKLKCNKGQKAVFSKALFLTVSVILLGSFTASAQIGLPTDPNIPDAPIDGLLGLGLAAGAVFGIYQKKRGKK